MYFIIKTIHIISSTILFGTGLGIAFFMHCSSFTQNIQQKYFATKFTVLADYIFTAPAVVLQPITGWWLITQGGHDPAALWLQITYGLYVLAGLCWLPVVYIQIRMKQILADCIDTNSVVPPTYHKLFRIWFCLGWPAFLSLVAIFYLMVTKPV